MEMEPEQERKIRELQMELKGLTDEELLDKDMKLPRPTLVEVIAMNYEMERRGISLESRIERQDKMMKRVQMIKEMVERIYEPEQQEKKKQMIMALVDRINRR